MSEQPVLFESVDAVMDALREHGYIADTRLATMVFLVTRLDKPLLVEGPAGVGKTELAKAVGRAVGAELVRLQCYEGLDEGRSSPTPPTSSRPSTASAHRRACSSPSGSWQLARCWSRSGPPIRRCC